MLLIHLQPLRANGSFCEAIPAELHRDYLIVLSLAVQDWTGRSVDAKFLVDTGSPSTVIDTSFRSQLALKGRSVTALSPFGEFVEAEEAVIPSLLIGSAVVESIPVLILDLSRVRRSAPVDGILGLDVLALRPFTLDYDEPSVCFMKAADSRPGPLTALSSPAFLTAPFKLEGSEFRMVVDTATNDIVFFPDAASGFRIEPQFGVRVVLNHLRGSLPVKRLVLRSLSMGGLRRNSIGASVLFEKAPEWLDADGFFGPRALRIKRLTVDPDRMEAGWVE